MTDTNPKRLAIGIGAVGAALVLAIGGRLAYTERARADKLDFDRKVQEAIADPSLKAAWARKLEAIDAEKTERLALWGNCDDIPEEERRSYEQVTEYDKKMPWYLPSRAVPSAEHICFARRVAFEEDLTTMINQKIQDLGTYESWAVDQSGVTKNHPWTRYPKVLVERIQKGERGLLLGPFWQYIL